MKQRATRSEQSEDLLRVNHNLLNLAKRMTDRFGGRMSELNKYIIIRKKNKAFFRPFFALGRTAGDTRRLLPPPRRTKKKNTDT